MESVVVLRIGIPVVFCRLVRHIAFRILQTLGLTRLLIACETTSLIAPRELSAVSQYQQDTSGISHKEYITDISCPAVPSEFTLQSFPINAEIENSDNRSLL
jgi:hypothetical protein